MDPFALATATFLIVPYVFVYDMTVACIGFAILIWRDWGELSFGERAILTLAFLVPNITLGLPALSPPILLLALWVQTGRDAAGAALPGLRTRSARPPAG